MSNKKKNIITEVREMSAYDKALFASEATFYVLSVGTVIIAVATKDPSYLAFTAGFGLVGRLFTEGRKKDAKETEIIEKLEQENELTRTRTLQ